MLWHIIVRKLVKDQRSSRVHMIRLQSLGWKFQVLGKFEWWQGGFLLRDWWWEWLLLDQFAFFAGLLGGRRGLFLWLGWLLEGVLWLGGGFLLLQGKYLLLWLLTCVVISLLWILDAVLLFDRLLLGLLSHLSLIGLRDIVAFSCSSCLVQNKSLSPSPWFWVFFFILVILLANYRLFSLILFVTFRILCVITLSFFWLLLLLDVIILTFNFISFFGLSHNSTIAIFYLFCYIHLSETSSLLWLCLQRSLRFLESNRKSSFCWVVLVAWPHLLLVTLDQLALLDSLGVVFLLWHNLCYDLCGLLASSPSSVSYFIWWHLFLLCALRFLRSFSFNLLFLLLRKWIFLFLNDLFLWLINFCLILYLTF